MEIKKYNISLKRYPNHIKKKLAEIPQDGMRVIVVLCRKCETLSTGYKTFPIFDFDSADKESKQVEILNCVDKISQEISYQRDVRIQYLIARISRSEYPSFLDGEIEDEAMQLASYALASAYAYGVLG